jgi:hypothetical protein
LEDQECSFYFRIYFIFLLNPSDLVPSTSFPKNPTQAEVIAYTEPQFHLFCF